MLPSTPTPPHFDEPRFEFTKRMELSRDDHARLKALAEERGLIFFSSPFSVEAVELLEDVGVPLYKIASGEVTNPPLLEAIAATGKPVLLSTGMSGLDDVERARRDPAGRRCDVLVLQCTSTYPCPPEQVNLRAMATLGERFGVPVGLSDHTPDIHTSIAAVALGAVAIEKHFTLSQAARTAPITTRRSSRRTSRGWSTGVRAGRGRARRAARRCAIPALDPARATFEKSVVARDRDRRGDRARARDADDEAARQRDPGAAHRRASSAAGRPRRSSRERTCSRRPTLPERRKICVVVASRANYARIKTVLEAVRDAPRPRAAGRRRRVARARALRQRGRRDGAGRVQARRDDPPHHRGRDARRRWPSRPASACSSCRRCSSCSSRTSSSRSPTASRRSRPRSPPRT